MKFIKNNIKFILGLLVGILISGGTVFAAILFDAKDVDYTPSNGKENIENVESALNDLYDLASYGDAMAYDIKSGKTAVVNGNKITGTGEGNYNWTMVVSYQVCLGWNGNYSYGCGSGTITIKNVDGTKTISNSGGTKRSNTESWNGSYYINTRTQSFSIVSFTVDN